MPTHEAVPASALKYPHLNLNVQEFGKITGHVTRENRSTSLFWTEKVADAAYYAQTIGLLWLMSVPWPWPFVWLKWSRPSLLFLLDVESYLKHKNPSVSFHNLAYSLLLLIIFYGAGIVLFFLHRDYKQARHRWAARISAGLKLRLDRLVLYVADFLYVPVAVIGLRLVTCGGEGKMIHLHNDVACGSAAHGALVATGIVFCFVPLALLPYYFYRQTSKVTVFRKPEMHEKYLVSRETEFVLGINDFYHMDHMFLCSSYKRYWANAKTWTCAQKFLLVLFVYSMNDPKASEASLQLQATLVCLTIAVPWLFKIFVSQYRCRTSNLVARVLEGAAFSTAVVGIFSAGRVRSSLLVNSTLSVILAIINVTGMSLAVLVCLASILGRLDWPVNEGTLKELVTNDGRILRTVDRSKQFIEESQDVPGEFTSAVELRRLIQELDELRKDARKKEHLLEWTLQDLTEQLVLVYENCQKQSLLPNADLEAALVGAKEAFARKRNDLLLTHPVKKTLFKRLLVIRGLLGDEYLNASEAVRETWAESNDQANENSMSRTSHGGKPFESPHTRRSRHSRSVSRDTPRSGGSHRRREASTEAAEHFEEYSDVESDV